MVFDLVFKFVFFKFSLLISLKDGLKYKAQIMHIVIADSDDKKLSKKSEGESIGKTDFINDKSIEEANEFSKHTTKELLKRADEFKNEFDEGKDIEVTKVKKGVFSFIDSLKKFLPLDLIDVAKLIANEWFKYYKNLMPTKVKLYTEFGINDPYSVGVILGFLSILYARYGKDVKVISHFDKNMLDVDLKFIGYPQIIFIIIPVLHLLLNKRFREVISKGKVTDKNID